MRSPHVSGNNSPVIDDETKSFLRYQLTQLPFGENSELNLFSIMNGVIGRTSNLKDVVSSAPSLLCILRKFNCKNKFEIHPSSSLELSCGQQTVKIQMDVHLAQLWQQRKVENTGGQPEEIKNFRDQVLRWRSDGILAFPMVGSLQILVTGWKVEFVQVSHVLDSVFCPWRRSNQVDRTIK